MAALFSSTEGNSCGIVGFTSAHIPHAEALGIPDRDTKPGDLLLLDLSTRIIHVLGVDKGGLARADELYGAGSERANGTKRWIHDEAAKQFMYALDPMSWFEPCERSYGNGETLQATVTGTL